MSRWNIGIGLGALGLGLALGGGWASGALPGRAPQMIPPAFAGGGLVQEGPGVFWTMNPDGSALYHWQVGQTSGDVTHFDATTGAVTVRKLMQPVPDGRLEDPNQPKKVAKELEVTGVIWTPSADTRTAIVNGHIVKEGEAVAGRSGKLYRVLTIHQDREVLFEEIKDDDGKDGKDK